jgi:sterol desaturase/sphingolipid hydroxylase (fatty acid hydroxylase superfamily)
LNKQRRDTYSDHDNKVTEIEDHENTTFCWWLLTNVEMAFTSIVIHLQVYIFIFTAIDRMDLTRVGTKINPRPVSRRLLKNEKKRVYFSAVIDGLYAVLIAQFGLLEDTASFSWLALVGWVLLIIFWTDFHFYVTHRILHAVPWLYRYVHISHHESHNPHVWSSLSFHPVEATIFFSAYLILLLVQCPTIMWWAFKAGMVLGPIHAHCGYNLGKFVKGPAHHYLHHRWNKGNFGGFPTGIWDKICGTELDQAGKIICNKNNWWNRNRPSKLKVIAVIVTALQVISELDFSIWICGFACILWWILVTDGMLVTLPPFEK